MSIQPTATRSGFFQSPILKPGLVQHLDFDLQVRSGRCTLAERAHISTERSDLRLKHILFGEGSFGLITGMG